MAGDPATSQLWLDHDAVLRAEVERLTREREAIQAAHIDKVGQYGNEVARLTVELAQAQQAIRKREDEYLDVCRALDTAQAEGGRLREALVTIQDLAGDQEYTEVKFEIYQLAKTAVQKAQRGGGS